MKPNIMKQWVIFILRILLVNTQSEHHQNIDTKAEIVVLMDSFYAQKFDQNRIQEHLLYESIFSPPHISFS